MAIDAEFLRDVARAFDSLADRVEESAFRERMGASGPSDVGKRAVRSLTQPASSDAGPRDLLKAVLPQIRGHRQKAILEALATAGDAGLTTGEIARLIRYEQTNTYNTLQELRNNRGLVELIAESPQRWRLVGLDLPHIASGKVREMFDAGEHILMVATDRISVFDVVLPTPIPGKGAVLAGLSRFWFDRTNHIVPNHLVAWRLADFPPEMRVPELAGRAQLVRKAEMIPLECVVRGYITGTGWKDYQATGEVCGHKLPKGLREAQQLSQPLFTPSTKAGTGHDENISIAQAEKTVGDASLVARIADVSVRLYEHARDYAASKGIILADTKYEFGLVDGELTVCDELFTPDSSRYWPADEWTPGTNPPSFDKQYVRDYAETIGWDKSYPGPELPDDVVAGTTKRYREAYERVTGNSFDAYMNDAS